MVGLMEGVNLINKGLIGDCAKKCKSKLVRLRRHSTDHESLIAILQKTKFKLTWVGIEPRCSCMTDRISNHYTKDELKKFT